MINLLGASDSKVQMVVPLGTVSATILVTSLVIRAPGDISVLLCFALLPWSLLS